MVLSGVFDEVLDGVLDGVLATGIKAIIGEGEEKIKGEKSVFNRKSCLNNEVLRLEKLSLAAKVGISR